VNPRHVPCRETRRGGVTLNTLRWGDEQDPPLLLLHGGGANAHWWDHLAPALARTFYVIALDFRGHGDSDYPEEVRAGAFDDDVEIVLEDLGRGDPVLVGHSMGARVALEHASRHPETRALVLIDPARGSTRKSRRMARLALTLRRTYATREEAVERYRFMPPSERAHEALRRSIAQHSVMAEADGRFGFKFDPRWFALPSRPPVDTSHVQCPVLLVRGADSALLSREGAEALAGELGNARLLEIDGAGHHVQLDRPQELLIGLLDFFASLRDPSATHPRNTSSDTPPGD